MQNDVSEIQARQWAILRAIPRAPHKLTVTALIAILLKGGHTASRSTIERDLRELSRRYPIIVDASTKPQGWSWMKNATVEFMPRLTLQQSLALSLVQKHGREFLPQAMMLELAPMFAAAERELECTGWREWNKRMAIAPPAFVLLPPTIDAKVLFDVQDAIANRLRITAKYRSKGSQTPRIREIHPLGMLVRGTVQYLVCLLPEREGPSQLCVHRMSDSVVSTERCREHPGFDMAHYAANELAIESRGKIRVRLAFVATAGEHLLETRMSEDQTSRPIEGTNTIEICATVDDDLQLMRWLRSFGSELVVMEPVHLREEMIAELRKTLAGYGG